MNALIEPARAVAHFVFDGPFSQIWPMLLLPLLARRLSDKAAGLLPPTRADWRVAAALAGFPGLVMLGLIVMVLSRSASHLHGGGWSHFVQYHGAAMVAAGLLLRALLRLRQRDRELRQLLGEARPPSLRLAAAAAAASIPALELESEECECFVAGVRQPMAFVSSGAVARMSDDELIAALHHERAHAVHRDTAMLACLSFLDDLARGSERALTAYRQARERIADEEAAQRAGRLVLASALLAFAKATPASAGRIGMAGPEGAWRLQAILQLESGGTGPASLSRPVWASLAANLGLTLWPLAHVYLGFLLCC